MEVGRRRPPAPRLWTRASWSFSCQGTVSGSSRVQGSPERRVMAASMSPASFKAFRIGLIQLATGANKAANLRNAAARVKEAAQAKAQVVVLPECFNSPYGTQYFKEYSETISPPGESFRALSEMAKANDVFLIGGSIPEAKDGSLYNTSLSFDNRGTLIGVYRKVHLFDIDVPGKIKFQESECLSPGNSLTEIETPYGKLGVAICYDIRFPEMAMIAARNGCCAMIYPGAFNLTTGPLHCKSSTVARSSKCLTNIKGNYWAVPEPSITKCTSRCVRLRETWTPHITHGDIRPSSTPTGKSSPKQASKRRL